MPESKQSAFTSARALLDAANSNIKQATVFIEWISPIGDVYYDTQATIMDIKLNQSWR
jgi:cob(I)alamin adenosyltransferase